MLPGRRPSLGEERRHHRRTARRVAARRAGRDGRRNVAHLTRLGTHERTVAIVQTYGREPRATNVCDPHSPPEEYHRDHAPTPLADATAPDRERRRNGFIVGLARFCVAHRWIVVGVWVALLVVANMAAGAVGPDYRTDFTLPDGEANGRARAARGEQPRSCGLHRADRDPERVRVRRSGRAGVAPANSSTS